MVVITDKSLNFQKHIDNLVGKTQYKLYALRCIRKVFKVEKAKKLGNAFIDSQFNYAPLIRMVCRKTFYSKIEKKTLKVIYGLILAIAFSDSVNMSQFIKGTFNF